MSALSVPNLLSPQAKPSSPQANGNAQPDTDAPFASVLQQKVQSGKGDAPAKQADDGKASSASETSAPAQPEQTAADNTEQESAAAALINGDYAQNALQQLLPWLQSMQGKSASPEAKDTTAAKDPAVLQETLEGNAPQAQSMLPSLQADTHRPLGSDKGTDTSAAAAKSELPQAKDATATAAANLAAASDALTTGNKPKASQDSFDATLQAANQRIESQVQQTTTHGTSDSRTPESNRLQSQVGTSQWQQEFSDRIQLMSRNNEGRAELVLTPPHLGRIEVTLNINGDQASAMFVSASPEVRTALEGAMDRLREALANSGIALGQAQVGAESSGQSAEQSGNGSRRGGELVAGASEAAPATAVWTRHSNSMLDVFA